MIRVRLFNMRENAKARGVSENKLGGLGLKIKTILLLLVANLLGCSANPIVYNPEILPESELARVSTEDIGLWLGGDELFTRFIKIWDADGKEIASEPFMSRLPSDLILSEGEYQFYIRCSNTNSIGSGVYSLNRLYTDIQAGKEYVVYCLSRTERNFLGIPQIKQMVPFISTSESYEKERAEYVIMLGEGNDEE